MRQLAPDLLLHPILDEAEALAGVPNREVVRAELRPIVGDGHSVVHQPALRLDVQRHCR